MLSRDNKNVKLALKLKHKKYRELENKFLIEGIRFVEEAIKEELVDCIFYSNRLNKSEESYRVLQNELPKYELEDGLLKELSGTESPQGVVAVVRKHTYRLEDLSTDFIVISDGIQDPGNLGSIIRTADAAGAGAVILLKGTVDLYNDKTLRATMGSIFHLPILQVDSFEELVQQLTKEGFEIYASNLERSQGLYQCSFLGKVAIVIGNEANGMPDAHLALATHKVRIPMPGSAESLNAAAAAAVMIYEVLRQRQG